MKRYGVLPLLPGWDVSPLQGFLQQYIASTNLHVPRLRETKCGVIKFLVLGNNMTEEAMP